MGDYQENHTLILLSARRKTLPGRNSTNYPPHYPADYTASIHHDGSRRYVQLSQGDDPRLGEQVTLRLRAALEAPIERVLLRICPDGEQQFIEMQPGPPSPACRWWQASLRLSMPVTGYRFLLFAEDGPWWYNGSGLYRHLPTDADDFRLLAGYAAPDWVRSSVFYQIFPDRFADGDPGNNVRSGEYEYRGHQSIARRWGESPSAGGKQAMVEFFGGDLAGITQRLDYVEDLGANALYLNPIFTAFSNHRYDVTDYYQVDPHLGGNQALAALRDATTRTGMCFILDIVPNHCGVLHPWFQSAFADPAAPTAEYFTFHRYPEDYACWLGVRSLPKLNYRSAALREVMYNGPQAVFRYWLRQPYAIDGWRLDVANMLARQGAYQLSVEIGRGIRQAVKQESPQAYLLGENFFDGTAQLQGDMWDATMNYSGFAKPLWYWLSRFQVRQHGKPESVSSDIPWPTQALVDTWQAYRAGIPWAIARQQLNLLGSHDTARILSKVGRDPALNRLAVGILFTYVGVPSIYYGDEVGMSGEGSAVRACMLWDRAGWDEGLRLFYQRLAQLRRSSPALTAGGFQILQVEENTLAYIRDAEEEQIIVIGNRGPGDRPAGPLPVGHAAVPDGTRLVEEFGGQEIVVAGGQLPFGAIPPGIQIWRTR